MMQPTDHPVWREDGTPFKAKMIAWIRARYAGLLGEDAAELDREGGLDRLAQRMRERLKEMSEATAPRPE